jgi:ferredoxin/flavodoxin---NADP+ reductase
MTAARNVVIVGAGAAGLFLADCLAAEGVAVTLLNRDLRPGGLVEYGIYPSKHRLKGGIRRQFIKALSRDGVDYLGGVTVGEARDLNLADIEACGADAVIIAGGAQGTRWLGLEGERRPGIYHAKELVYHYTGLPPYGERPMPTEGRVLIVGMGNVSIDISHWLVRDRKISELVLMARRGPAERKYTPKELAAIAANVDRDALREELERVRPALESVGQDVAAIGDAMAAELDKKPLEAVSETRVSFRFLTSPVSFSGATPDGPVERVTLQDNQLVSDGERLSCKAVGAPYEEAFDTVVFAVGDAIDTSLGLQTQWGRYFTEADGDGTDPKAFQLTTPDGAALPGMFTVGWARRPSEGLVGTVKQDAKRAAIAVLGYLAGLDSAAAPAGSVGAALRARLEAAAVEPVELEDVWALQRAEASLAEQQGVPEARYHTNAEMRAAIARERSS